MITWLTPVPDDHVHDFRFWWSRDWLPLMMITCMTPAPDDHVHDSRSWWSRAGLPLLMITCLTPAPDDHVHWWSCAWLPLLMIILLCGSLIGSLINSTGGRLQWPGVVRISRTTYYYIVVLLLLNLWTITINLKFIILNWVPGRKKTCQKHFWIKDESGRENDVYPSCVACMFWIISWNNFACSHKGIHTTIEIFRRQKKVRWVYQSIQTKNL